MIGADISFLPQLEDRGMKFKENGEEVDAIALLKKHGYSMGNRIKYALAQELTNRAILTQIANRRKSDKNLEVYSLFDKWPLFMNL